MPIGGASAVEGLQSTGLPRLVSRKFVEIHLYARLISNPRGKVLIIAGMSCSPDLKVQHRQGQNEGKEQNIIWLLVIFFRFMQFMIR